jgi:DNA-directed RNA polymerase subunit RPC12/RpoP
MEEAFNCTECGKPFSEGLATLKEGQLPGVGFYKCFECSGYCKFLLLLLFKAKYQFRLV